MASNLCQWNLCEESFDSHKELINHVHSVHINANSAKQTGKFLCKWKGCFRKGKGFDQRCKLVTHARTHTEERPFFCETCQKQFIRHENLKIHMRTHTGDRPYVCPEPGCEKAFSNTSDRTRHTKTHRTQKPYVCKTPGCAKKYTDAGSLRKHARLKNHLSSNVDHHQLVRNNASHSVVVSSTNKLPTTIQKADSAKKKKGIHSQSVLNLKVATSTDATHYFHKSTQTDAILFPQLSSITPRNNDLKMVNPAVSKSDLLDTTGNGLLDLSHTLNENDVLCLGIGSITSQNLTKRDHANIKDSCLLDIPSISTVADRDDMFLARVKDQGKCSGDVSANPVDLPDCFADCGSFTLNQCKPAGLNLSKDKDVSVGGKLDQSCCSVHICDENVAVPVIETPCSVPYSTTPSKSKTPVKNSKCDILPYTTYPEDINLSNYLFGNNDYVLDLQVSCLNLTTVKNLSLNNKSEPISETGNCAGLDSLIDTEDITNTLVSEVSLLHDMNDVNSCEHSGTLGFVPTDQNSDLMLQDTGNDVSQAQSVMSSLTHERTKNNADSLKLVTPISLHNDNPLNCLKPLSSENTIAPLPYNSYSNLLVNYISEDCNPMLSSAVLKGSCLSVESSLQSNALNLTLNSVELEHGCVGEDNMDISDVTASQEVPLDLSTGQIEEFFPQTSPALLRRSRRKVKRLTLL